MIKPGDRRPDAASILRVDQAGEYGATRIYAGQLAVMGDRAPAARIIAGMASQEEAHRKRFDAMIDAGLVDEVRRLRERHPLTAAMPSMRSVGYRQAFEYLDGLGDRILLREDVVIGVICATLATLGAHALPRHWRYAALAVLVITVASWPVRTGWAGGTAVSVATPPNEGLHPDQVGSRGETYRWSTGDAVLYLPAGARRVRVPAADRRREP